LVPEKDITLGGADGSPACVASVVPMPTLKTAMSRANAAVAEMHRDWLLVACVLLSMLLHALALVAYRGQASIGLRDFESRHAHPFEVTLRPSTRSPRGEEGLPEKGTRPRVERSRLSDSSSNPADVAAQAKTRPDATGDQSAPRIDMEAVRGMVREIERAKALAAPGSQTLAKSELEYETPLGRTIANAARPDCRVARAGMGLLAVLFLVKDAITHDGCRW